MIHFDLPKQKSSIIKVIGVGGGGSNAVNYMFSQDIEGVDFIICNTDSKAIEQSKVPNKIQLGPHLTQGLGAGANPEVGKAATEESLEEIKRILEVNTKMAFITAGMGGGTGTGGAPIISKICKDLGILTVGIVTTPFGFEGPRRMQQAEEGIKQLKPYVDTLLVISNDKLRMQYGNLKMKEAFTKADNVLATAAKCITDIINSRGHIIVDFADVCTVMKNGGVAILGKAEIEGEDRAQRAIEEALNSPLLNDSDIKGAKWILININSAEGDDECTMDELETINNYLRMQAGESTDVIVGTGYDNNLGGKISITLVATGFDAKDPFAKHVPVKKVEPVQEKIVMTLGVENEEKKLEKQVFEQQTLPLEFQQQNSISSEPLNVYHNFNDAYNMPVVEDLTPTLNEFLEPTLAQNEVVASIQEDENTVYHFELSTEISEPVIAETPIADPIEQFQNITETNSFLTRPTNIYADVLQENIEVKPETIQEVQPNIEAAQEQPEIEMTLVMREEIQEVEKVVPTLSIHEETNVSSITEMDPTMFDEGEEQRRRAAERIQKLRNLSFNNTNEANSEFDAVPAYIRRNMELFGNTLTSVENFYSKYTVNKEENNNGPISSINTFLDGKKPD
jgi:cell division protein FtsZ